MSLMPRLRELNIHLRVPISGILSKGQLPTVETLSVPINQIGDIYEAASVIRACPKVTLLRLNLSGPSFQAADSNGMCRPETRRALEAAAKLGSLRDLELSKFGTSIWDLAGGVVREDGWVLGDLKGA